VARAASALVRVHARPPTDRSASMA
jgi:hypothetical protein